MQWLTSHEVSILLWEEWGNHWQQLFISLFSNIEPSCLWTSVYEALAPQTKSEILLLVVVVEEDAQASSPFLDLLWNSLPPKKELPRLNEGYNFRIPFGNEMMWQWPSLLFPQATGGSLDFAVDDRRPCLILVRWLSCGMMVGPGGWEGSYLENQSIDDPAIWPYFHIHYAWSAPTPASVLSIRQEGK